MKTFKEYITEGAEIESFIWEGKPLYHGTSIHKAKKILSTKKFAPRDEAGVNEIGYGIYTHPSMNRTSPWAYKGGFIEIHFHMPLNLAIHKRGLPSQRDLTEQGYVGLYDKNGYTQIAHQVLLFAKKPLGMDLPDINRDIIDWERTRMIVFNDKIHGYLEASDEEKQYYY